MADVHILRFDDVAKSFGGTHALKGVSLAVGARRDRGAARRERRRQVDPDQDARPASTAPTAARSLIDGEPYRHRAGAPARASPSPSSTRISASSNG